MAFFTDVAGQLLGKITPLAVDPMIDAWNLKENLEILQGRLRLIDALLSDIDCKRIAMSSIQDWMKKLKVVAHVANVFMDDLTYEVTRQKIENRKVSDFFRPSKNRILYRFKVARKINYINFSFDKIFKWAGDIGLKPVEHLTSVVQFREIRITLPFVDHSQIVGRDVDVLNVVQLLQENNDEDLPVIAVLGMGGLGKTTLAQIVYKRHEVIDFFPRRMWVTVSDDFDVMRILNEMIQSLTRTDSSLTNPEAVIIRLKDLLKGEKFLLVLDDVWSKISQEWDKMRNSLLAIGGSNGSKILVTTRNHEVVAAMTSSLAYQLQGLSYDDSWTLFTQRAFAHGGVLQNDIFKAIGRRMVERCDGLPLAIQALGGLMHSKKSEQEWLLIENSETWIKRDVLPSLRLSYNHLPSSTLKQCFAYCSTLPKDSFINKDTLIEIWVALGLLLTPKGSGLIMEDVGEEYFNILLWNSLLQDVERDDYGNILKCKMHDLVHDLALNVSENYSVTVKANHELNLISNAMHVRLVGAENINLKIDKKNFEKVQTLCLMGNFHEKLLPTFKNLNVLVLNGSFIADLSNSLGKLKRLKYLDISGCNITKLPNSMTKLYNLQTLTVRHLKELPKNFGNLINMRHLYIKDASMSESCVFYGLELLTCLQTLPFFVVSRDNKCHLRDLEHLDHLKRDLRLYGLSEVSNIEEAKKARIYRKSNVHFLKLCWNGFKQDVVREDEVNNDEDVMEGLKPHTYLKELHVSNFNGKKFASWMMVASQSFVLLSNLVKIRLEECNKCEKSPQLGHLPKLKEIEIIGMSNVEFIGSEFYGQSESDQGSASSSINLTALFPSLKKLAFRLMPKLEKWAEAVIRHDIGDTMLAFPCLEVLQIEDCANLTTLPSSFGCLKQLRVSNLCNINMLETMSTKLSSLTSLSLSKMRGGEVGSSRSDASSVVVDKFMQNNSTSLRFLSFYRCDSLTWLNLVNIVPLEKIYVNACNNLTTITAVEPDALKTLQVLNISSCKRLDHLPNGLLEFCRSLNNLHIWQLPNLVSYSELVPAASVRTLRYMRLGPFSEELDHFPWPISSGPCFVSLLSLNLRGWRKLQSLPDQLLLHPSPFPALKYLALYDFNGLEALPDSLGSLSSLQYLRIWYCKKLASFPVLEVMQQRLANLDYLEIGGCPLLRERCGRGTGPEWCKISHIPKVIWFDGLSKGFERVGS